MFYVPQVLGRKGPLAIVWLAAHLEKNLKKSDILNTDIEAIIEMISNNDCKLSLRIVSDLSLGLLRIQARKIEYLSKDVDKIILDFSVAMNILPRKVGKRKRKTLDRTLSADCMVDPSEINLPEIFDFDNYEPPRIEFDPSKVVSRRSITLPDVPYDEVTEDFDDFYGSKFDLADFGLTATEEVIFQDDLPSPVHPVAGDIPQNEQEPMEPIDTYSPILPPPNLQTEIEEVPSTVQTPAYKPARITRRRNQVVDNLLLPSVERKRFALEERTQPSLELINLEESHEAFSLQKIRQRRKRRRHGLLKIDTETQISLRRPDDPESVKSFFKMHVTSFAPVLKKPVPNLFETFLRPMPEFFNRFHPNLSSCKELSPEELAEQNGLERSYPSIYDDEFRKKVLGEHILSQTLPSPKFDKTLPTPANITEFDEPDLMQIDEGFQEPPPPPLPEASNTANDSSFPLFRQGQTFADSFDEAFALASIDGLDKTQTIVEDPSIRKSFDETMDFVTSDDFYAKVHSSNRGEAAALFVQVLNRANQGAINMQTTNTLDHFNTFIF